MDRRRSHAFEVPAPPEVVWPLVSDPATDYRTLSPPPTVEAHHPSGTPGAGSTYRVVTATGLAWVAEIVTWEPPHRLETRSTIRGQVIGTTSLRLVPTPGGCRIEMELPHSGVPGRHPLVDRVVVALATPLFGRAARKQAETFERTVRDRLLGTMPPSG